MSLGTYDTQVLQGLIQTLFTPSSYWLDSFFGSTQTFEQEYIDFDVLTGGRRMAPFVSPLVQGKPVLAQGYTTKRFKPAYIKPKDVVDPNRIIKRRAGEPLNGSLSLQARKDAVVSDILTEHKAQINRRWEWMAAQAVITGKVTVAGSEYPSTLVDFGRRASHTVVLTGTALWTDTVNSNPLADLENNMIQFQQDTGFVVDRVTMATGAWKAYRVHPKVIAQLNLLQRGTTDSINPGVLAAGVAQLVGHVGLSQIPIYVYNDIFEDATSTAASPVYVPYLPVNTVVLTSSTGIQGVRAFGAILDADAGYAASDIYVKNFRENDPSLEFILSQSAPLMIPTRPDCSTSMVVV
jgi:hypothetical protein